MKNFILNELDGFHVQLLASRRVLYTQGSGPRRLRSPTSGWVCTSLDERFNARLLAPSLGIALVLVFSRERRWLVVLVSSTVPRPSSAVHSGAGWVVGSRRDPYVR